MVLDNLASWDGRTVAAALVVAVVAAFGAGYAGASMTGTPSGAVTGDAVSEDQVKQKVQSLMDKQVERQRQQIKMMAAQSENLSADDLSMDATVTDVSASDFDGLYKVTVSMTGQVPGRQGGLQQLDKEQTMYISEDGRYLFAEPTDLEKQQQTQARPQPSR